MPEGSTSTHTGSKGGVPSRAVMEGRCPVSCKVASVCRSKGNSKESSHLNRRIGSLRDTLGVKSAGERPQQHNHPLWVAKGLPVKGNHEGALLVGSYRLQQLQQSSVQQWAYATWRKSVSN